LSERTGSPNSGTDAQSRKPPFWVSKTGARIALIILHLVALATVVIEFLHPFGDDGHGADRVHALDFVASYAVYGFFSCVVLVLLGRELRRMVMRKEDYYEDRG